MAASRWTHAARPIGRRPSRPRQNGRPCERRLDSKVPEWWWSVTRITPDQRVGKVRCTDVIIPPTARRQHCGSARLAAERPRMSRPRSVRVHPPFWCTFKPASPRLGCECLVLIRRRQGSAVDAFGRPRRKSWLRRRIRGGRHDSKRWRSLYVRTMRSDARLREGMSVPGHASFRDLLWAAYEGSEEGCLGRQRDERGVAGRAATPPTRRVSLAVGGSVCRDRLPPRGSSRRALASS